MAPSPQTITICASRCAPVDFTAAFPGGSPESKPTAPFASGFWHPHYPVRPRANDSFDGLRQKNEDQAVDQKLDNAVAKTEQAATDAKAKAVTSIGKAEDAMKDLASKAKASSKSTAGKVANTMDDVSITTAVSVAFLRDPDSSALKIDVDTKDDSVTLNGPATTLAAKKKATTLAKAVKGVVSVDNKLVVKAG